MGSDDLDQQIAWFPNWALQANARFPFFRIRRKIRLEDAMDWSGCRVVESVPGKVSGTPVLIGSRLPVEAITGNFDAFLDEGLTKEQALAATLECYPEAGIDRILSVLEYRAAHEPQLQP